MSDSRSRAEWARTAELGAWIINSNPFRTGEPVTGDELNPFSVRGDDEEKPAMQLSVGELFKLTGEIK